MKEYGIGIIGWGFMGRTHAHAIRALPLFYESAPFRARLVGVCARTPGKADAARDDLGFDYATRDYMDIINDSRVDVVSICTPNDQHEAMMIAALRAGKHIYVDKPLTVDEASALRIREAAIGAAGKVQVALHNRFFTATMRARELVQEGALGEILTFNCRYLHSGSIDPQKPMGWKMGAGAGVLLDLGSHALDLVTWIMGLKPSKGLCAMRVLYPERPKADGTLCHDITDDQAIMMLQLENGALGSVEASKITAGASDEMLLEITGTKGAIRWNLTNPGWLEFYDNTSPEVAFGGNRGYTRIECLGRYPAPGGSFLPAKNAVGWDRAHIHCYYSFLNSIYHNTAASPSLQDGVRLQTWLTRLAESAQTGQWVAM